MVTMDDKVRVAQSLEGAPDAFEALVREYQRMIYSLCYRMTGSPADAEDLTQESFIDAYRNLAGFRAESRFSSWLYRIALNRCLNWQKRGQRRERLHREWSEQQAISAEGDSAHTRQVQDALLQLDPKQRAAVVLTIYDGLNHAEAAGILGCSETTVSWRLFTARRKLKRLLKHLQRDVR